MTYICEKCQHNDSGVADSRPINGTIRRRRYCKRCNFRWTTYEVVHLDHLQVTKSQVKRLRLAASILNKIANDLEL